MLNSYIIRRFGIVKFVYNAQVCVQKKMHPTCREGAGASFFSDYKRVLYI